MYNVIVLFSENMHVGDFFEFGKIVEVLFCFRGSIPAI